MAEKPYFYWSFGTSFETRGGKIGTKIKTCFKRLKVQQLLGFFESFMLFEASVGPPPEIVYIEIKKLGYFRVSYPPLVKDKNQIKRRKGKVKMKTPLTSSNKPILTSRYLLNFYCTLEAPKKERLPYFQWF